MMWNSFVVALLAGAVVAQIPSASNLPPLMAPEFPMPVVGPAPAAVAPSVSPIAPVAANPMMDNMANLTGMEPGFQPVPMTLGSPAPSSVAAPPASIGSLPVEANMPVTVNMPNSLPSMAPAAAPQIEMPATAPMVSPMVSPMMVYPSPMAPMMTYPSPMMTYPSPMMTYPSPGYTMYPSMEPSMYTMYPSPMVAPVDPVAPVGMAPATANTSALTIPVAPVRVICPNTCRLSFKGVVGTPSYVLNGAPDAAFTPGITGANFATALEVGEASVNGMPISSTGLTPNVLGLYAIGFRGSYGVGYRTMSPAQKATLDGACVVLPITHYIDGAGTEVVVSTNPAVDCVAFRITAAVARTPAPVVPVAPVLPVAV